MAGETTVLDVAFDNVGAVNFQPYQVCVLDTSNSGVITVGAAAAPTTGHPTPLGVVYDKAKLDMSGNPVANSGVMVRVQGVAKVICDGAVSVGARITCSATTAGQVTPVTQAIAGAQPVSVLGIAWKQATATNDATLVLLTPGATW
jgi:hypothetical protein